MAYQVFAAGNETQGIKFGVVNCRKISIEILMEKIEQVLVRQILYEYQDESLESEFFCIMALWVYLCKRVKEISDSWIMILKAEKIDWYHEGRKTTSSFGEEQAGFSG